MNNWLRKGKEGMNNDEKHTGKDAGGSSKESRQGSKGESCRKSKDKTAVHGKEKRNGESEKVLSPGSEEMMELLKNDPECEGECLLYGLPEYMCDDCYKYHYKYTEEVLEGARDIEKNLRLIDFSDIYET